MNLRIQVLSPAPAALAIRMYVYVHVDLSAMLMYFLLNAASCIVAYAAQPHATTSQHNVSLAQTTAIIGCTFRVCVAALFDTYKLLGTEDRPREATMSNVYIVRVQIFVVHIFKVLYSHLPTGWRRVSPISLWIDHLVRGDRDLHRRFRNPRNTYSYVLTIRGV